MLDVATRWLPAQIKALRKRLGMSQEAFAEVLGYERRASVSDLETGRMEPSGPAARVLDYLDTFGVLPPKEEG